MKKYFTAGAITVVAIALGGVGYMFGKNIKDNEAKDPAINGIAVTDETKIASDKATADALKLNESTTINGQNISKSQATDYGTCPSSPVAKTFYNKIIGLEFCYPSEWGEATIGSVPASASAAGGAYEITFAGKAGLTIASATADWQNTIARDGRCADPQQGGPQFDTYIPEWKVEKSEAEVFSALRVHIKKEPHYLIRELADTYFNAVCMMGIVATPGGAYDAQGVVLNVELGSRTITEHVADSTVIISTALRVQFSELVDSMHHAE